MIYILLICSLISNYCLANTIEHEFPVSTIIDKSNFFNSTIVITGLNGNIISSGDLIINRDGTFGSRQNIYTEARIFDVESEEISDLITSKDYSSIRWRVVVDPIVSSSGATDVSSSRAILYNHSFFGIKPMDVNSTPLEGAPELINRVTWSTSSAKGGEVNDLNPGDTLSVTARIIIEADL
ncbi:TPA: hypothetical protein ACX6Q7_001409 [Photobacterium damselae]